jgi:hypothetical protein
MRNRLMRAAGIGAASTMLAGGAAFATAGAASAAPAPPPPGPAHNDSGHNQNHNQNHHQNHNRYCHQTRGHWQWVWHHGSKGHHHHSHHSHHGYWVKVWVPGHWVCNHRGR